MHDTNSKTSVEIVRATLGDAMAIVAALNPAPLPFAPLAALHCPIGLSPRFAPAERATEAIALNNIEVVVERARPPSPRWAIELVFGEHLRASGSLHAALPLNRLIRLDTVRAAEIDENPTQAAIVQADALRACLVYLNHSVDEAANTCRAMADRYGAKRVNSRAPQLYSLLSVFGPLRSSQIETVSGVKLYSVTRHGAPFAPTALVEEPCSFSREALAEYDASLASIDVLRVLYNGGSEGKT